MLAFLKRKPVAVNDGPPEPAGSIPPERNTSMLAKVEPLINEGRVVVDPQMAATVLTTMNYPGQRKLRSGHVAALAAAMRRKAFTPGGQIAFARIGKSLQLINGQHRLSAVIEAGRDIEFQVLIVDCKNHAEVAKHYYSFDRLSTARSDADVLSAVGIPERWQISPTMARAVWQCVPIIEHGFERVNHAADPDRRDDDRRLSLCSQWWPVANRLEAIVSVAPAVVRKRLVSAQAVAVALVILKEQPEEAEAFLSGIASDDGLRRDDPRKALLIDMAGRQWRRHSLDGCLTMAYAWNAFFLRRPLSQLKVVQNARFRLEGTSYDGRGR
jgi:hypothetical protein